MTELANPIGSLRHISDQLMDGTGLNSACYIEWLKESTADEVAEANKAYEEWEEKTFPRESDGQYSNETWQRLDEACNMIVQRCSAYRQDAFEKGMQAGGRLMLELLGVTLPV
jgi:hypothetical protein